MEDVNFLTTRTKEDDRQMVLAIYRLTEIMKKIINCEDIECLDAEIRNLVLLTKLNKHLWNFSNTKNLDPITLGLRKTISEIPSIIERNTNFKFDFNSPHVSQIYRSVKKNIETIFRLLQLGIEVEMKMDTKKDTTLAYELHKQMNNGLESLEKQRKQEEERMAQLNEELAKQREEEQRLKDIRTFYEKSKRENELRAARLKEQLEKSKAIIKDIDGDIRNLEDKMEEMENVSIVSDNEDFGVDSGEEYEEDSYFEEE